VTLITHTLVLPGVILFTGLIEVFLPGSIVANLGPVKSNRHSTFGRLTMNDRHEGTWSIIAALLVLFTAILDPRISAALAVILLVVFALYKFAYKPNTEK